MSTTSGASFPHLPMETWEAFLAGDLADAAEGRVEAHLAQCAACRMALERADPSRIFRRLAGLTVRDEVWAGFWDDVSRQLPPRSSAPPSPLLLRRKRLGVAAGAVAATLLVAAVVRIMVGNEGITGDGGQGVAGNDDAPPCPSTIAHLRLSREECAALYGGPIASEGGVEVILQPQMDLRGL